MTRAFSVTWDYRCPFARNAHEHLLAGLDAGADWDVTFVPFSLNQMHVPEGGTPVWDDPEAADTLFAPQVALVVQEQHPEAFRPVHFALFAARHDEGKDIRERDVIADVLRANGLDPEPIFAEVDGGASLATYRKLHEAAEGDYKVWGVPTFINGDRAVFVRLMTRPQGDGALATKTIEHVMDLVDGFVELNEFKQTHIPR